MTPHAPIGSGRAARGRRRGGVRDDLAAMAAVGLAVLLDLALFAAILGFGLPGARLHQTAAGAAPATLPPLEVAALDPSCDGDAWLRAAAQAAVCLTPLADDVDACLAETRTRWDSERLLCHVDQLQALPAVALVDQRALERLAETTPIDAEALLEPLTPEEQRQFQAELAPPPPPPPAVAPPPPPPPSKAQVIETPKPATEEAPDQAAYLAEYDSKTAHQQVARGSRAEDMVARPAAEELTPKADPKPASAPTPPADDPGRSADAPAVPGALSMRAPGAPDRATVAQDAKTAGANTPAGDGPGARRGDGAIQQEQRRPVETAANGQGGGGGGSPRAPDLRPDDATLERLVGGGSVDKVDVDEGEENAFNTKRWVYASFFNRMKRMVAQNWDPVSVWRREDPDGTHYGLKNRNTILQVSLDAKGVVQKILVLDGSGVDSLDDEAIRSFQAAGPFPNPPQGLVDSGDGLITFEFGFYFEINARHTAWKISRG